MNYSNLNKILRPKSRKEIDQDINKLSLHEKIALNAFLKIAKLFEHGDGLYAREEGRKIVEEIENEFSIHLFSKINDNDTLQITFYLEDHNKVKQILVNRHIPFLNHF